MVKRKLRKCANCGGRHGPPTGKGCSHLSEVETEKIDVKTTAAQVTSELGGETDISVALSDDQVSEVNMEPEPCYDQNLLFSSFHNQKVSPNYGDEEDFRQKWATEDTTQRQGRPSRHVTTRRERSPKIFQGRVPAETLFEKRIADKVEHMENVLGRVAGVQQAQLQRLIDMMTEKNTVKSEDQRRVPTEVTATAAELPAGGATAASRPAEEVKGDGDRWDKLPRSRSPAEDLAPAEEEWREYHGEAIWQKEKDKKRKNPFDHQAYIKKGDVVESFETLMVITFKTLKQLIDLKYDVKGLIRHGQSMAEKAAKGSYKKNALIGYDESVRERAGEVGPSAFGVVEYDDVFRFFCADNTVPKKLPQGKPGSAIARVKSDKICHRYNDAGCQSKNCIYAHKCASCELWGHPQKDCRRGEKKKEAK